MACPHSQLSRSAVCSAPSCTTVCALPDAAAAACDSLARSTCTVAVACAGHALECGAVQGGGVC
eukprot:scaffold28386_cov54-Phaeocystis_antarctica.AAC.2